MAIYRYLREMHPLRLLLLSALLALVLGQVVAMVMVAQSQVQRAVMREEMERSTRLAGAPSMVSPAAQESASGEGFTQVSFAATR
ncbi:hypothetical protein BH10PSE18_BH10PSE18_09080 [soil metagenome]